MHTFLNNNVTWITPSPPKRHFDVKRMKVSLEMPPKLHLKCIFVEKIVCAYYFIILDATDVEVYNQLCKNMRRTSLEEILHDVDKSVHDDFYAKYRHDFVCIVHHSGQAEDTYATMEMKVG